MANIEPIDPTLTDPRTAATLTAVERKLGMLPNLIATLARAPAALSGYLQLSEALAGGRLDARQRELIALVVAQHNGCGYCLSAHTLLAKKAGLSDGEIRGARAGDGIGQMDQALVAFAGKVVAARGILIDAELEALRTAGFDDGHAVEIIANVALNVLTNYLNNAAATEIDFPAVDLDNVA